MAGSTVLVVEDEPRIVEFLVENLRADDYSVLTAGTAEEAIELLAQSQPDLMLLDVVLPGMSGIDLCRRVRGGDGINEPWDPDLPIIMLSAKAEHTDRVRGSVPRRRRLRRQNRSTTRSCWLASPACLKRVSRVDERHLLAVGELVVNTLSKQVKVGGIGVQLSVKEFQLLATLAAEPERVFSKQELLEQVWGFKSPGRTRTLDSHASRLRQKLAAGSDRAWIANVWGHGYRVCAPE